MSRNADEIDPLLVQQLRSDGRWLRRQLSAVDAVSSSIHNAPTVSLDAVFGELDALVGNETVKQDIHGLLDVLELAAERRRRGLPDVSVRRHLASRPHRYARRSAAWERDEPS